MRSFPIQSMDDHDRILEAEFRIAFAMARYTPMSSRGIPCMRMFSNPISRCTGAQLFPAIHPLFAVFIGY
jgi:hypothetical protein